jgi:hypothetical protein
MCTVTLLARREGYALGMNRDEKLTRVSALPPQHFRLGNRQAIFPSEPTGGTWIGVNDGGITLALINWYSVPDRAHEIVVSRGEIVRKLLSSETIVAVDSSLASQPLSCMNPFRLIVVSRDERLIEWRWDLHQLRAYRHPWLSRTWISSGFDEPGAQRIRGNAFAEALKEPSSDSIQWLRRIHSSHGPKPSPYSTCMHREDAATVSYTEIEVADEVIALRYSKKPLCCSTTLEQFILNPDRSPPKATV